MNKKFNKASGFDKFDGYMPGKKNFIHDDYYVSCELRLFHMDNAYAYPDRGRGFNMGIQKKMYMISPEGFAVDSSCIGQSDK